MLNKDQLVVEIIKPVLKWLDRAQPGLDTPAAVELLLGTAIQESRLSYLEQVGKGKARSIYQIEPATEKDMRERFLAAASRKTLKVHVTSLLAPYPDPADQLAGNLYYATAIARIKYFSVKAALPPAGNLKAQAAYWKRWYNTPSGAGTEAEYIEHWKEAHA